MTRHERVKEISSLYSHARKLREKAIWEGIHDANVDVRACMDIVLARLDMLGSSLGEDLLKIDTEEKV